MRPRLFDVHMKDLTDSPPRKASGSRTRREMPIEGIFERLSKLNYKPSSISNMKIHEDDPMPDDQSFAYMRGVLTGMGSQFNYHVRKLITASKTRRISISSTTSGGGMRQNCHRRTPRALRAMAIDKAEIDVESRFKIGVITTKSTDLRSCLFSRLAGVRHAMGRVACTVERDVVCADSKEIAEAHRILTKYQLQVTDIASPLFKVDWQTPVLQVSVRNGINLRQITHTKIRTKFLRKRCLHKRIQD